MRFKLWLWALNNTSNDPKTFKEKFASKLFEFLEDLDCDGRR
jgi:hypothetical protein